MKQVLIWVLNVAAWVLHVFTVPLRFVLKRVWPGSGDSLPPPVSDIRIPPAAPDILEKPVQPAVAEPRLLGKEKPIEPAVEIKPGWFALPLEKLPHPTYWPVVLGLGIIFGVFGVITTFIFTIIGVIMFVLGLIGWIGDMWNEQPE